MSTPLNVIVMIHGMIPESEPSSPFPMYDRFWDALVDAQTQLTAVIGKIIPVQWGQEMPGQSRPPRIDEKLTRAQNFLESLVSYEQMKLISEPNNVTIRDIGIPIVQQQLISMREQIILHGLGDVVFYCSGEGEKIVRSEVYRQVLSGLKEFEMEKEVRLHVIGHSLGVTIAHDFLYGLFRSSGNAGFLSQGDPETVVRFQYWQTKARIDELKLGSFVSFASQLPLFVMRKEKLVEDFYSGKRLDPKVIGIRDARLRWLIFHDVDDLLGFASRRLYSPRDAIKDIQVNCGLLPDSAHVNYWKNKTVITETARLIFTNSY